MSDAESPTSTPTTNFDSPSPAAVAVAVVQVHAETNTNNRCRKRKRNLSTASCDSSVASTSASASTSTPTPKKVKVGPPEAKAPFDIEAFLECNICLDFASSPIHSCVNAHVLCGQCAPKVKECPMCKQKTISPSAICEKLAREANKYLPCTNSGSGCKEELLSTKFSEHLAVCYFRDMTCFTSRCARKIPFPNYTSHLKEQHQITVHNEPKIKKKFSFEISRRNFMWNQSILNFEGCEFIIHAQVDSNANLFFSWISVLGDQEVAKGFSCRISMKDAESPNKFGCTWIVPVIPYHEVSSHGTANASLLNQSIMGIPIPTIHKLGTPKNEGGIPRLSFHVKYEIASTLAGLQRRQNLSLTPSQ